MDAAMMKPGRPLAITDDDLQAQDPERLAYEKRIDGLREEEYPMLEGV